MQAVEEKVYNWLSEAMGGTPFFLLELKYQERDQRFSVLVDGDNGVPISQCAEMSRLLAKKLEEAYGDEHPYAFEVSSPGADRPLHLLRQYNQHMGRDLQVTMQDGTMYTGKLKSVEEEKIVLVENQKQKNKSNIGLERQLPFADIKEAKVIIKFK